MSRNPPWERDELTLVLDYYVQRDGRVNDKRAPELTELSLTLNALAPRLGLSRVAASFRSPASVYMKLMNFRSLDPDTPSVGLPRCGELDREVWEELRNDAIRLREQADAIRMRAR